MFFYFIFSLTIVYSSSVARGAFVIAGLICSVLVGRLFPETGSLHYLLANSLLAEFGLGVGSSIPRQSHRRSEDLLHCGSLAQRITHCLWSRSPSPKCRFWRTAALAFSSVGPSMLFDPPGDRPAAVTVIALNLALSRGCFLLHLSRTLSADCALCDSCEAAPRF